MNVLLKQFRRNLAAIRAARVGLVVTFVGMMMWASRLGEPAGRRATFLFAMGALVGWIALVLSAVRQTREVQTSGVLAATGQFDRAEAWLKAIMTRFSFSANPKIMACQQLAALCFRRDAHEEVVAVCRELLRQRLTRVRNVLINTRLMLADSLLLLDRVNEAYEAMRPVYDLPLSLADRMKLLPIQLRYELAADHASSAVQGLPEKVQIAELLDSLRAALVHALLAEACRRQGMPAQRDFLLERARLYGDVASLAQRYGVITPVVTLSS